MSSYAVFNILDLAEKIGEEALGRLLSDFSCPQNNEIESFLKRNALDFARKKISVTHLVFNDNGQFVAYFTLTHKAVEIQPTNLSGESKRKLARYVHPDERSDSFTVSAFLIAQFAKNAAAPDEDRPDGNQLMQTALDTLLAVQHEIGGGVVYLECEDHEKLLAFYQNEHNRYKPFGERVSDADGVKYIQLLRFI